MNAPMIPKGSGEHVGLVKASGQVESRYTDLECNDYTLFPVDLESAGSLVSVDINRKISCLILDGTLPEPQLGKLLSQRYESVRQYHPPQVVLLAPEQRSDEPKFLKMGADRVLLGDTEPRAKHLIIGSLIDEYRNLIKLTTELGWRKSAVGQIEQGVFRYYTRREARNLATMLSLTCPDPVPAAVGLTELLVNAVEHGCLGLKAGEKEQLILEGRLDQELAIRRASPENDDKSVVVAFESGPDFRRFTIVDPGDGFDHAAILDGDFGRVGTAKSGRGVMMAQACFSTLAYEGRGNIVTATVQID